MQSGRPLLHMPLATAPWLQAVWGCWQHAAERPRAAAHADRFSGQNPAPARPWWATAAPEVRSGHIQMMSFTHHVCTSPDDVIHASRVHIAT